MSASTRGGRPPFAPTEPQRRQVKAMAAYGVSHVDIAKVLEITAPSLRKHFRHELDTGQVEANARVAESLFKRATGEGHQSVTAAIFWLKCRARWREYDEVQGKKDAAMESARTAGIGTPWEELLHPKLANV